jgi:hypothetical protein
MFKRNIFIFVSLFIFSCTFAQKKINVLYLGNSLTYFNNLPEIVKKIAACDSVEMTYRSLSQPNYALVDHWDDGLAQKEIKSGMYDFVVVQQGPSSQAEGREYLLNYGLMIDSLCDQYNATLVSYMVWPQKIRSMDFSGVFDSYKLLADSTHGIFAPAGKAWLKVWDNYPQFMLYGEDNFHPHYRGSLLAAMTVYGSMRKKTSLDFIDYNALKDETLTRADFNVMVRAAERTLIENKSKKKKR